MPSWRRAWRLNLWHWTPPCTSPTRTTGNTQVQPALRAKETPDKHDQHQTSCMDVAPKMLDLSALGRFSKESLAELGDWGGENPGRGGSGSQPASAERCRCRMLQQAP